MQECPKCGFVQPKDKYCANCGLDIESYKPAPDPLLVRLKKSTAMQIGAVVVVVLGMTAAIFISQRDRIVEHLSGAAPTKKRPMPVYELNQLPTQPTAAANRPEAITAPPQAAMAFSKTRAPTPPSADVKKVYKEMTISFFEVSKTAIMQLMAEGQLLNETAQTKSFLLNSANAIASIKNYDSEAREHGETRNENFDLTAPFNLDFTHISGKKAGENVGMSLLFTATAMTESLWDFTMEANINLKNETGGTLLSSGVNGSYSMPPKSALILVGFLPHQKIANDDLWSFSNSPLQIYGSDKFINGLTEFVIVIQPK